MTAAFDRLRPRLLAMIARRLSSKLAVRIDPEEVLQEAYLRARGRRQDASPGPTDLDAWVYRQVNDRLIELMRGALGPKRDVDRDLPWPDGSAAGLAEHFVDSHTGPETALSRAERCAVVRAALEKLDPGDREILALRYFDGLGYDQIAVILGIDKANTVNQRALRALMKLRNFIPHSLRPRGEAPS